MSTRKDRFAMEADEIAFFADYYEHERYNLVGWSLRLERELASVLRACKGQRLDDVLTLGCGDGQFELMLAPYAGRITALDISPQAIKVARHKAADAGITNVEFLCLPLHTLAWDRSFDCMICLAFLHHLREPDLAEFLRTARDH